MQIFQWFSIICFVGLLFQLAGFTAPFLDLEYARTNEVVRERYGSFAGSTLVLGFYAAISTIFTYYNIIYLKDRSFKQILFLILSISTLLLAQSRRYYVFSFIIMLLIYLAKKKFSITKIVLHNKLKVLLFLVLCYISFYFKDSVYLFQRFYSVFDYQNDGANVIRAIKWIEAIENFLNNFWFGAGLGNIGAVGKNVGELSIEELTVAESYFLKVFVEGGVFFGVAFVTISILVLKKAYKIIKTNQYNCFAAYLYIFFFIDCFMSMTMEYVIGSVLFWLAIAIIITEKNLTDPLEEL